MANINLTTTDYCWPCMASVVCWNIKSNDPLSPKEC